MLAFGRHLVIVPPAVAAATVIFRIVRAGGKVGAADRKEIYLV